jgi:hypothetical protein
MTEPTAEQIRNLLERAMSDAPEPHTWADVERRTIELPEPRKAPRGTAIWLACAASVVALVGGFIVFIDSGEDDVVRTHTPSTTVTENPMSPTTQPVPDTISEVVPTIDAESEEGSEPVVEPDSSVAPIPDDQTTGQPRELGVPRSGEVQPTVIGDITWTLIEGDASTQPPGVTAVIDGVFYGLENDGQTTWRSADGVEWELTDLAPNGIIGVFELDGETWARRSTIDGQGLGRWDGEVFAPVELPESLAPDVEGLRATPSFSGDPVEFDGQWVVPVTTRLGVPWDELYPGSVYPEWDAVTESIRMVDWESNQPLPVAVLTTDRIDGDPGTIEFRDSETGELVIAVEEALGFDPEEFFNQLVVQGGFSYSEFLIGDGDGFEAVASPWPLADRVELAPLDGTLLAVVGSTSFDVGGFGTPVSELWASTDARTWEPRGLPTPFGSEIDWVHIDADGSLALLTLVSSDGNAQRSETWSSVNGIAWEVVDEEAGFGATRHTDIGWFREAIYETGGISVSSDGLVWQEIPFDIRQPAGPGGGGVNVLGGTIFVTHFEDGGERRMWVGQVADD